jgi:uncharacterized protein YfaS (alpha-2-macroglobulin family)
MLKKSVVIVVASLVIVTVGARMMKNDPSPVPDPAVPGTSVSGKLLPEEDRAVLWQEYEKAVNEGLPKTAIEKLDLIHDGAVRDKAWPEAIRAKALRIRVNASINQPGAPLMVKDLTAAIEQAAPEMKPMLQAIMAEWFFSYYNQNRWRFMQRSQTTAPPGDDIETWDLARLLGEVDRHFTAALANSEALKKIPVGDYDMLLSKGSLPDKYRPTVYDFVAFRALDFYGLDEQFIRQQGAFRIAGDSPVLGSAKDFIAWKPETVDDDSYLLRAVRLYQELMQFHANDDDRTAWLDADLHRLQFAAAVAGGSEVKARYRAALQAYADEHIKHPLSSLALARLAGSWQQDSELVKAMEIARTGSARFPDSHGGKACHNIAEAIQLPSVTIETERVWNESGPTIDVSYRNVNKVWFRLYKFDFENWPEWGNYSDVVYSWGQGEPLKRLGRSQVAEWSADLPATADYRERTEKIPVDVDVASGCYVLIASHKQDFSSEANQISSCEVWVSELALVVRATQGTMFLSGHVLNATTGMPVAGAEVRIWKWRYDGRNSSESRLKDVTTDENGLFSVKVDPQSHHRLFVKKDSQVLGVVDNSYFYDGQTIPNLFEQSIFLTDRAIYRPGQSIQFKVISVSANQQKNDYKTISGRKLTVVLFDMNNQEVETRELVTNEFGSASGSFTAPSDRATGPMYLRVTSGPGGQGAVRVEEYKRPKFAVEVEPPKDAPMLKQEVGVTVRATAYTGAPVDSAKVVWRVVRNVRYPYWYYYRYWYMPQQGEAQEIANGESMTGVDGTFEVRFVADPDPSIDRETDPKFGFTIYADVTDSAGETRSSSTTITVGYTSLEASINAGDWLVAGEPVKLDLSVTNLNGQGQATRGTLKVHALTQPEKVHRAKLQSHYWRGYGYPVENDTSHLSSIDVWPTGDVKVEEAVTTGDAGTASVSPTLPAGAWKAVFETVDAKGQPVRAEKAFLVIDPAATKFETRIPNYVGSKAWSVQPGEEFLAVWGTGYQTGRAFVELEHRGKVFKSWWTPAGETQHQIRVPVNESHRGGLQMRITYIRENRAYIESRTIQVPWSNKDLKIRWERFVSKLQPGGKETWTAIVEGPDAQRAAAEMVAAMYDASLDAFVGHSWQAGFGVFYNDYAKTTVQFHNRLQALNAFWSSWQINYRDEGFSYRTYAGGISEFWGYEVSARGRRFGMARGGGGVLADGAEAMAMDAAPGAPAPTSGAVEGFLGGAREKSEAKSANFADDGDAGTPVASQGSVDLDSVTARKNLNETAFFYPVLTVDEKGTVRIEFEIPEALTKWKFLGFAHDNELRASLLTEEITTSKDLMAQPNPPRFLREGDVLEFSVKLTNRSDKPQAGKARLTLADARTGETVDAQFIGSDLERAFDVPGGQSMSVFWKITVPDFVGALTYKVVAATDKLSDGEEGFMPVLTKRVLVIESLPLPIRGKQTKTFDFESLRNSGSSESLRSQSLTVQMVSNPAWYAVMALPYLMEYPHECSEQTFNRLYANSLARHIVMSDPKIARIFEQWRGTPALDSPLEKNEDLKNVTIAESPWLREAKEESQSRRDVGILFEQNRLDSELKRAFDRLAEMQYSDGSWPWFPGGRANDYITLYITTGFGRLRHLGVEIDVSPALRSLDRLDAWIRDTYNEIVRHGHKDQNNLSSTICLYLYGRSFFLEDKPVDEQYREAFDYFVGQGKQYWVKLGDRQPQGHLAIALKRIGDRETPAKIVASLIERSLSNEEMGMFWREDGESWWWYRAPIETQALMIECLDEVAGDAARVEDLKVWLLKQKQTQNWKTTKSTADAIYALLLRGTDVLASDKLVSVKLAGEEIRPDNVEAGTGFYEQRWVRGEIKPEMANITVSKSDDGVAWGSVHWQYLEDMSKVKPYEGTPLTLKKALYTKTNTDKGPVINEVKGPVKVGDELVMRVEVRVDRDMEYVHLKDYRGSGTEPVNVLSQYKFQDGLYYYESTRDTASHFFIDYLPRGTYVFEYSVRVQHRGQYQTGFAEIQCMYAPEFNSHSGSVEIVVE